MRDGEPQKAAGVGDLLRPGLHKPMEEVYSNLGSTNPTSFSARVRCSLSQATSALFAAGRFGTNLTGMILSSSERMERLL